MMRADIHSFEGDIESQYRYYLEYKIICMEMFPGTTEIFDQSIVVN